MLAYYRRQKATHKALVVEALLCVLRQLLAASSNEDARGRGFLHFDEAYGLYNSFFEKPVEKAEFRDHLLDSRFMDFECLLLLFKEQGKGLTLFIYTPSVMHFWNVGKI